MIQSDTSLTPKSLQASAKKVFEASAPKILSLQKRWKESDGTPVFTIEGKYTSRGWTEWTEGFVYGSAILQYDATGDESMLQIGRDATLRRMAVHVTHIGVHDHGFNNVSTYGNLRRLLREGRLPSNDWESHFYDLALKASGAVQASRWTQLTPDLGYIRSFNGPQSLFSDTIRSLRALSLAHILGHRLMGENDAKINLLHRSLQHAETTARYNVYYGKGRDTYDVPGRVVHESIFNVTDGAYRCPSTQQGYSAFTTWTRGHAWLLCGFPEQYEFLELLPESEFKDFGGKQKILDRYLEVARVTADSAQGLLRLARILEKKGDKKGAQTYLSAGLTTARTLFSEPYLSSDPKHEGLLLHTVYHRPNGWDHIPKGRKVPCGEAAMWGDYHLRELALYLLRLAEGKPYLTFFGDKL